MKTINKLLVAIVLSASLISSAFAGELTVTGTAKASYAINSSDSSTGAVDKAQGLGISNEISFLSSGELDNGMTWAWQANMDQANNTTSGGGIDDVQLTFGTSYGNIQLNQNAGSLRAAALGWDVSAFGAGTDNGDGGGFVLGTELSAYNNIAYHTPAGLLPFGIVAKIGYAPSADGGVSDFKASGTQNTAKNGSAWITNSSTGLTTARTTATVFDDVTQATISAAPIDGLTVSIDYTDFGHPKSHNDAEEGHISAKYAFGPVTVGYGRGWISPENDSKDADAVESFKNTSMGIGFKVNDALSLSYTKEKSELNLNTSSTKEVDLEVSSIQAAYNIGGATVAVSQDNIDNANYALNKDTKETLITLVMAF